MAFTHGRLAHLAIDSPAGSLQTVSPILTQADYQHSVDRSETQTFGNYAKRYQVLGLQSAQISVSGFFAETSTKRHGRSTVILHGAYNISSYFDTTSVKLSVDLPETQTFGDSWKEHAVPGLKADSTSMSGFHDKTATSGSYDILRAAVADSDGDVQSIAPNGFARGNLVELLQGVCMSHSIPQGENDVTKTSAEFMADNGIDLGVSLHDLTSETATVDGASVDETAATADGGWAHLHVTSITGTPGSITFKVQQSANDTDWTDLVTFTAVTAIGAQRVEVVAGTAVARYLRFQISAFTTFTAVTAQMSFARRGFASATTAGAYRHWRSLMQRSASTSFEAGPDGNTSTYPKLSGEVRLQDLSLELNENDVIKFSGTLITDGAVTEGTW